MEACIGGSASGSVGEAKQAVHTGDHAKLPETASIESRGVAEIPGMLYSLWFFTSRNHLFLVSVNTYARQSTQSSSAKSDAGRSFSVVIKGANIVLVTGETPYQLPRCLA